ncbi:MULTISPECIES: amidohydrolase [unclassified Chelatococcus]|uniref:amidohydrolase n=1 Tax=unclassified Chelatococcus TaxID=2638111 RepID=UPI001BCFDC1F|nr:MULTISPECIES: amidohydrolase [unclassified Chelatococcus]CAH1658811.1 Amidohydro_3 domain-containing protein [Hyphomicrobiales bacterium]MBS7740849.1 amidohydrolase [Chelatococcus sp. HY11]MBX3545917.1 amidohydrolase [Chelatococcus sp.]MCO5079542.1 amidohydrolase [Chelatococcus sp.]CAH1684026.1 Amidohydro_3 domain-containing protein [Hyphomicrobiales bacterium]
MTTAADLILLNGKVTTLDRSNPQAQAVAIKDGRILLAGTDADAMAHAGPGTKIVDVAGRRVVPGLIDSHMHIIRGGLNYNMELRWDGVRSLAQAMDMLRTQVAITPPPQWVRVVGGFTEHQFAEKRLPTLEEINAVAPDTPVFILHLYDRALLNGAALRAVGYTKDTPNPPGGEIVRDARGNPTGLLIAQPNATILYATLAKGPRLPAEYQKNSTRHFMREVNRLGVTSVIDAGGGFQNYPDDYAIIEELHREGLLTVRIAYNLFTQKPKEELRDFESWAMQVRPGQGDDLYRHNGAGEMLVYSAADFEDFQMPRPEMPSNMEADLEPVVRLLAENGWPWRLHATYDETISRALDVFEKVNRDIPLRGLNWFFDHAETISDRNIERIARLGGGIAVQHRMAYQGEYFVERYGHRSAERTPPIRKMLDMGVPVGAGTDATRVASYNPWVSLYWLVTGKTVGGLSLYPASNRLDRETALQLWTQANGWFSNESGKKGQIRTGQLADIAVLSADYFSVREDEIQDITAALTLLGGTPVHGDGDFRPLAPDLPPPMPDWSPVRRFGGYQQRAEALAATAAVASFCGCANSCNVHGHGHATAWGADVPVSDARSFWGALGCACWAV